MSTEKFEPPSGTGEERGTIFLCPFCKDGAVSRSSDKGYLVCPECRRKIYEIHVSLHRMRILLDAFEVLQNEIYDKHLLKCAGSAYRSICTELEMRGSWLVDDVDNEKASGFQRCPDFVLADKGKGRSLSKTAVRALGKLLEDHDFGEGPAFLNNALRVLYLLGKLTADQRQLRRQLEAMTPSGPEW